MKREPYVYVCRLVPAVLIALCVVSTAWAPTVQARGAASASAKASERLRLKTIMIRPTDVPPVYSRIQTWVYSTFRAQLQIGKHYCKTDKSLTASTWKQGFMEMVTRTDTKQAQKIQIGFALCAWAFTDVASAKTQYAAYEYFIHESKDEGFKVLSTPRIADQTIGTTVTNTKQRHAYHAVIFRRGTIVVYVDYNGDPSVSPAKVIKLAQLANARAHGLPVSIS